MRVHRPSRPRRVLAFAACLLLAACATPPTPPTAAIAPALFDDAGFAPPTEPVDPDAVFRLSPAMDAYVRDEITPASHRLGLRQALTQELYDRRGLQLEYEASMTRDAAQAFDARQGNCLSLVIMTAAFAKALDLPVTFQQVVTDEMWSRAGGMYFMSGHVNLQIGLPAARGPMRVERIGSVTIDFMPTADSVGLHAHPIDEGTVVAMYFNNRAAEAMVAGQLDDAYWRARAALRAAPGYVGAWNTLGVIYLHHGDAARAAAVFAEARRRAPDDRQLLANSADTLHALGRDDEAQVLRTRLSRLEPVPPFQYFNQGQAAFHSGDLHAARALFRRALDGDPDYHEFHFWLAVTDFDLGQVDEARSELALALADAVKRTDHDLYAAKLDRLNAVHPAAVRLVQ